MLHWVVIAEFFKFLIDVEHLHLVDAGGDAVGDGDSEAVVVEGGAVSLNLLYARSSSVQELVIEVNAAENKIFFDKSTGRLEVDRFEVCWKDLLHYLGVCALTHRVWPCSIWRVTRAAWKIWVGGSKEFVWAAKLGAWNFREWLHLWYLGLEFGVSSVDPVLIAPRVVSIIVLRR
jgi:hypothetical protein